MLLTYFKTYVMYHSATVDTEWFLLPGQKSTHATINSRLNKLVSVGWEYRMYQSGLKASELSISGAFETHCKYIL